MNIQIFFFFFFADVDAVMNARELPNDFFFRSSTIESRRFNRLDSPIRITMIIPHDSSRSHVDFNLPLDENFMRITLSEKKTFELLQ